MAEIIFQSRQDAVRLFQHLSLHAKYAEMDKDILLIEDRYSVKINNMALTWQGLNLIKKAFYEYVTGIKLNDWLKSILSSIYLYDDPDEQAQIIEIIYSVLDGERKELAELLDSLPWEKQVMEAVEQVFRENLALSFDSFVKFRMRPFFNHLTQVAGISIDEYKMEQDYQVFIEALRDFLSRRPPKRKHLHVLFGEEIIFYDEELSEIRRGELSKMIDRKLLSNHPLYIDSVSIAPLLSIAPETIYLYTEDPDQPIIRTIRNIFEERVNVKRTNELPDFR